MTKVGSPRTLLQRLSGSWTPWCLQGATFQSSCAGWPGGVSSFLFPLLSSLKLLYFDLKVLKHANLKRFRSHGGESMLGSWVLSGHWEDSGRASQQPTVTLKHFGWYKERTPSRLGCPSLSAHLCHMPQWMSWRNQLQWQAQVIRHQSIFRSLPPSSGNLIEWWVHSTVP